MGSGVRSAIFFSQGAEVSTTRARSAQFFLRRELPCNKAVQLSKFRLRRKLAVATDRSEGDIVVVGVGGGSVESEGRTALLGDSGVVW